MNEAIASAQDLQHGFIRPFQPDDFGAVARIVGESAALDRHTTYSYWANYRVFGSLFLVLESEGQVRGFAMSIGPNAAGEALFWQIGIAGSHRGQGLGKNLALTMIRAIRQQGGRRVLVTIAEGNNVSRALFEGCARACNTQLAAVGPIPRMADDIAAETLYGFALAPESK